MDTKRRVIPFNGLEGLDAINTDRVEGWSSCWGCGIGWGGIRKKNPPIVTQWENRHFDCSLFWVSHCALWLSLVWMKVGWFSKLLWSNPTMWKVIATDICIQGCFKAAWFLLFKVSLNSTDPASAHKTKNKTLINDGGSLIPPRYVAGVVLPSPI